MHPDDSSIVSRRRWLGLVSTASITTGLLGAAKSSGAPAESVNTLGARVYNIRDFGAIGDGKTLDTVALQSAIDACVKDQGGTVLVPAGVFAIGTVELKSNVTLRIAAQGKLLGTDDGSQYHAAEAIPLTGDSTLEDGNVGLIFAVNAENITIEGPGVIDGQGHQFLSPAKGVRPPAGISGSHRPYHLLFYRCQNLTVRDIFLKDSAFHSVRIIQCRYVQLTGIHIHGRVIHNNDGFHFISSQYVNMTSCNVESQDDACALFGSCKFVMISDCSFSTRWSVFRFGGGVAENITISNCIIYEAFGCPIKMRCGPGSRFENISFSNLVMKDVTGPISIGNSPHSRRRPAPADSGAPVPPAALGVVRGISFHGIRATVSKPIPLPGASFTSAYKPGEIFSCITLNGFDEALLENISFDNVHVTFPGGGTAGHAAVRDVPKVAGEYYEIGVPPAYGMFARNVRALTLQNVRFEIAASDLRPAIVLDHISDAAVNGLSVQGDAAAESALRIIDSKDILLSAVRLLTTAAAFLQVEGAASDTVTLDGGDISKAATPVTFKNGAAQKAVKTRV